jgi:DNA-binding NtrC family response regulator
VGGRAVDESATPGLRPEKAIHIPARTSRERNQTHEPPRSRLTLRRSRFRHRRRRVALQHPHGRRIEAATRLGLGRNTITRKIQELGLED